MKIMGYADDVTPVTSHADDIPRFEHWMGTYERATGATFSKAKSELLAFGMVPPTPTTYFNLATRTPHTSSNSQTSPLRCAQTSTQPGKAQ